MTVIGINGIGGYGDESIALLLRILSRRGLDTYRIRLPLRLWMSARWKWKIDGSIVVKGSRDGDILIAHSYGCLRAWYAHHHRDYAKIFCIAPAMSPDAEWRHPERVHCWYSATDWAVRMGAMLLFHPFGSAGNRGFSQPGVVNYNCRGTDHSGYFQGAMLDGVVNTISAEISRAYPRAVPDDTSQSPSDGA